MRWGDGVSGVIDSVRWMAVLTDSIEILFRNSE